MTSQLALYWSAPDRDRDHWQAILAVLSETVQRVSLKEAAYRLGVEPSALAHALRERDRHYVRAEWIAPLLELAASVDLGEKLAAVLVAPARLSVVASQPLTPEQELQRIHGALLALGDVGQLVLKKAGLKP